MLARLAHDLEIQCLRVRGEAEANGDAWTAKATIVISDLEVVGALRGGHVDRGVLSASDRTEIEQRLRDAFGSTRKIEIAARGSTRTRGDVELVAGEARAKTALRFSVAERAGALVVNGGADVSMKALGVRDVKGPLGAFKLADTIAVHFEIALSPAAAT